MGSPVTQILKQSVERGAELLQNHMGNMENELQVAPTLKHLFFHDANLAPVDKQLHDTLYKFIEHREAAKQQLEEPIHKIWKHIESNDAARTAVGGRETPLADVHAHLATTGNPLASESQKLLNRASGNSKLSLLELHNRTYAQASLEARMNVLGKHSAAVMPLFEKLYSSPNPVWHSHADAVANMFSVVMHDRMDTGTGVFSAVKKDIRDYAKKQAAGGSSMAVPRVNFLHPTYEPTSGTEHEFKKWITTVSAPFMAIPHIGTAFNLMDTPASAIMKGIFDSGAPHIKAMIQQSAILASTMHAIMEDHIRSQTGLIAETAGHKAGLLLNGVFHNPGFNRLRTWQLSMAGSVGYHAAIEWGQQAARGSRRAIAELQEMHLDHKAIIQRGGQLTDEELRTAMFHYVNNRMFIDKSPTRALYSGKNPWIRTALQFHAFVGFQANYIKSTLLKMAKAGDMVGLAQFAGSLGVLFPVIVAPAMKSAERLLQTGSFSQAQDSFTGDYEKLSNPQDAMAFAHEYVDLMSHLGAFGVYFHFMQSAERFQLPKQLLGPGLAIGATALQDLIMGSEGTKKGTHNWEPLGRDALRYGIPVAGGALSHQLLPTKKEHPHARKY